jgi:hypothetical protein
LFPPPAIPNGNRDRAFGVVLTNNVAVEFLDDLARREVAQSVGHFRRATR